MNNTINIAVVGLGQVGIYLLNELNTKKKEIELKTGKKINVVAVSAKNINKKRQFKVNKKVKRLARKSALSYKLNEKNIIILEDFNFDNPSTKSYSLALKNFDLLNNKTLLVLDKPNNNILLSSRNLAKAKVVLASELNTYDIMNANKMLFVESSIKVVEETF